MARKNQTAQGLETSAPEAHAPNEQAVEKLDNKMEAVRRAIDVLGKKATPTEIQDFVKTHYGVEMSSKMASVYKSKILRKGGRRGRRGRKPKGEATPAAVPPQAGGSKGGQGGVSFHDLRMLKELNGRLGHAHLRELVELIAK